VLQSKKEAVISKFAGYISELSFPKPEPVVSLRSIAHLFGSTKSRFGSTKSRCGIYLLVFPQERAYVGQAIEVVRRFAQHRLNHDDIIGFSFIPVQRLRLDETEKILIRRAERLGLTLLNTVHASSIVGETDLDLVISSENQKAWLEAPELFNQREHIVSLVLPESQTQRFSGQFRKFQQHPLAPRVLQLLSQYVCCCNPSPKRTEYSFWAVSCLPATNRNAWPRLVCVNLAFMEAFVVGSFKDEPREMWGFVNVASDVLYAEFGNKGGFIKAFPSIKLVQRNYRDAGQHQLSLHAHDESSLSVLIQTAEVRKAAATLVLRVMRKRATIYGKFRCNQLADCLLSPPPGGAVALE
jgi:hypothetical protein